MEKAEEHKNIKITTPSSVDPLVQVFDWTIDKIKKKLLPDDQKDINQYYSEIIKTLSEIDENLIESNHKFDKIIFDKIKTNFEECTNTLARLYDLLNQKSTNNKPIEIIRNAVHILRRTTLEKIKSYCTSVNSVNELSDIFAKLIEWDFSKKMSVDQYRAIISVLREYAICLLILHKCVTSVKTLETLSNKINIHNKHFDNFDDLLTEFKQQHDAYKDKYEKNKKSLATFKTAFQQFEGNLHEFGQHYAKLNADNAKMEAILEQLRSEINQLKLQLSECEATKKELARNVATANDEKGEAERQTILANKNLEALRLEHVECAKKIRENNVKISKYEANLEQKQKENAQIKAELDKLNDLHKLSEEQKLSIIELKRQINDKDAEIEKINRNIMTAKEYTKKLDLQKQQHDKDLEDVKQLNNRYINKLTRNHEFHMRKKDKEHVRELNQQQAQHKLSLRDCKDKKLELEQELSQRKNTIEQQTKNAKERDRMLQKQEKDCEEMIRSRERERDLVTMKLNACNRRNAELEKKGLDTTRLQNEKNALDTRLAQCVHNLEKCNNDKQKIEQERQNIAQKLQQLTMESNDLKKRHSAEIGKLDEDIAACRKNLEECSKANKQMKEDYDNQISNLQADLNIEENLKVVYGNRIDTLDANNNQLNIQNTTLQTQIDMLQEQIRRYREQSKKEEEQQQKIRENINQTNMRNLQQSANDCDEYIKGWRETKRQLQIVWESLRQEHLKNTNLNQQVNDLTKEIAQLKSRLTNVNRNMLDFSQKEIKEFKNRLTQLTEEARKTTRDLRNNLFECQVELWKRDSEKSELNKKIAELYAELSANEEKFEHQIRENDEKCDEEKAELKQQLENCNDNNKKLQARITTLNAQILSLAQQNSNLTAQNNQQSNTILAQQNQIVANNAKITQLNDEVLIDDCVYEVPDSAVARKLKSLSDPSDIAKALFIICTHLTENSGESHIYSKNYFKSLLANSTDAKTMLTALASAAHEMLAKQGAHTYAMHMCAKYVNDHPKVNIISLEDLEDLDKAYKNSTLSIDKDRKIQNIYM